MSSITSTASNTPSPPQSSMFTADPQFDSSQHVLSGGQLAGAVIGSLLAFSLVLYYSCWKPKWQRQILANHHPYWHGDHERTVRNQIHVQHVEGYPAYDGRPVIGRSAYGTMFTSDQHHSEHNIMRQKATLATIETSINELRAEQREAKNTPESSLNDTLDRGRRAIQIHNELLAFAARNRTETGSARATDASDRAPPPYKP